MKRIALAVLVLLAAAGGAYRWLLVRVGELPSGFQGYVEGNLVYMAPEEGGRIERLAVESGDGVEEGQLLFALEASVAEAQRSEAEARLRQAEAQIANLRAAQQRPEQIAILQAARERAAAALDYSRGEFERQKTLYLRGYGAKARLDQAEAAFERDKAALDEAERQIQAGRLGSRTGEIEAAEASARASEAALRQAETRLAKRRVGAPAAAKVQDVFFRAGEVVNAGQPVLALLPPANLRIRFYVPEPLLATLALGQSVAIACDSCPEGLTASISYLSREAEYTPPVIFSQEERAKLVFRAEARPARDIALPIGLPVTVRPLDETPVASRAP